jgi:amino acid adenylation domain-containing protein
MSDLRQRIADLSPEKRALFEQLLMQQTAAGAKGQAISRRDASAPCPLSFAQQRLWFLDQFEPNSPVYNVVKAVKVQGALDVAALQQALEAIVVRHEVLRTRFAAENGTPVQVISAPVPVPLSVSELGALPAAEREVEMYQQLAREVRRPFDLARDVLLRAALFELSSAEHMLLLTMGHIASDAWSMSVLVRELGALYRAFARREPPALPALPIQYADYAVWQRQWLQGEVLETQLAYWRRQLGGAPTNLELPTDRPRPAVQSHRGARYPLAISARVTQGLKALSRQEGVTLFMTLLAAWQLLLHRYTGQADISVGSPIAGRTRVETEPLIGFFVNTLVLRTDLSGNPTFRELLQRVRQVAMEAYARQDIPFEKLVAELQPERTLSHSLLFQVLFAFQNVPRQPLELSGVVVTPVEVDRGTAKFDLSLYLWETDGGLKGTIEYNTDLFDQSTIARLVGHFSTMLEGIAAVPEQRLAEVPVLTAAERRQVLVEWNATRAEYPRQACLHDLVGAQAQQTPEQIAVVYDGASLSYRQLNARANQLAHYLQRQGVRPERLVGICIERGLDMVVGLLGILKAGGVYLPLDPSYPWERLQFMLEDAGVSVILTQRAVMETLPTHQAQVICLDTDWEHIAVESEETPVNDVASHNLAYVIYTSGSTGRPKGVLGLYQGMVNRLHWMWERYPFAPGEVCCQKTSLSFVDSVCEIFGPLLQGIPTVIIPDDVLKDPQRLVQTLEVYRVTRVVLVPSLLQVLLDAVPELDKCLPHLQYWITSGEALSHKLSQRFAEQMPQRILLNLYGSSEVSADSTCYEISGDRPLSCVPIGRPIANTQIYVLDAYLQPVPIGVPGELYIGGTGLARGYLNRPELTAEKFIPHPFSDEPGARLYKTGDLARYLPDGNLEYLGRLDHQIKIRGVRMELGEIEAVLGQHPAVRQAVVLAREETPGDTRLAAYVVPTREPAPTTSELRGFLKAKLPESMVPTAFVVLEALPLTPSGKVDRNALPQPEGDRPALERGFVAPHDVIEWELTHMWEDLLGVKPIGVQDDFFELGGHSLLAVQLFAYIEKQIGTRLPLVTLFQRPTIAHLAQSLRDLGEAAPGALPYELPREHAISGRIRHPIGRYLPSKYHPYVRRTYRRLKRSSLGRALGGIYVRHRKKIVKRVLSYTPTQLENQLKTMGITTGDTLLMHSAFRVFNGFKGTPDQVIACVLNVIGKSGNLVMVSMPYGGSTAAYLQAGVPFDVQHTMSAMGVITEIFRHTPGVVRSLNPAHPILAWGPAAPWLIAGHEHTRYSCGKGSPFEKLVHAQAQALLFDVSLRSMTFFHYVKDQFQDTLPVKLYEERAVESIVIDTSGEKKAVKSYVFSSESRRFRSQNLQEVLIKEGVVKTEEIGNTKLIVLQLAQVVECAQRMVMSGKSLWKM